MSIKQLKQIAAAHTALSPPHPEVLHEPLMLPDVSTSFQLLGSCTKQQKWKFNPHSSNYY